MNRAERNDYHGRNESYQTISNEMQNLSGQLYCATNAIQANIVQVGNKIDTALRKCKRIRVSRELGELTSGEIVAIDTFSDESKAVIAYLANLWGPCEVYRFEIDEDDWDCGIFGLYYKGSQEWIVGLIEEVENTAYLYNLFNRLGFKWHGKIPVSDAKRVLCEEYANKILMTKNTVGISVLAGWKNGHFQYNKNFPFGIPEGITNFPVHTKNFKELDLSEEMAKKYFEDMRRIKDEKDRLMVMVYPFLSIIAHILSNKGHPLNFGLNFIKLSEFERDKICGWLQIFNRKFCTPMSADISEKEFAHELRTVKDECLILDCAEHSDESPYEKDKKRKRCQKAYRTILENRKVSGRKSGPICAGVCTLSSRFQAGKAIYNIFLDDDWFKEEGEALEPNVMEGVFSAFVKFVENHMDEIEGIIAERYGWKDDRESMIFRGSILVERFWKSRGFNLIEEAGIHNPIDFGNFFKETSYEDEENLEIFLQCFRKGIALYEVVPKDTGKFRVDMQIYYDKEWILIPTRIMDKIIDKCGGRKFKLQVLAELKESKILNTDSEGLSKRLVIAGERREVYQIKREFFNKSGYVDVIALGGESVLTDMENNQIRLSDNPNRHILVLGSSGQGKTFFCCQRMEEELERGRNVLVYDFSSSYREKELEKAQFKYKEKVEILNPYGDKYYFPVKVGSTERFCKSVLNVLANDLKVQSYLQKTALLQAIKTHMKSHMTFNFAEFFCTVERLYAQKLEEEGVRDERDSFLKILTRLEPYSDIENVNFEYSDVENIKTGITIIQLSDFPEHQRQFLTEFLIGMLWEEIMTDGNVGYDTVVLDEFQHLSMSKYGALPKLLRQSRKNGLSLILLSQFIRNYTPEEQDLLLLAGNILLFKPTVKDRVSCADIVDRNNIKFWATILDNLQVGEAVLAGNYFVKNCPEIWQKPVICKVRKEAEKKQGRTLNPNYRKQARRRCALRFEQH